MTEFLERAFHWIDEIFHELELPGVSKGTFMNRPSLRLRGKSIVGSKNGESLVVHCPLELKEALIEADPELYFETDHYKGYPAILMHPEKIDKNVLKTRIEGAWRMNATKAQLASFDTSDDQ